MDDVGTAQWGCPRGADTVCVWARIERGREEREGGRMGSAEAVDYVCDGSGASSCVSLVRRYEMSAS